MAKHLSAWQSVRSVSFIYLPGHQNVAERQAFFSNSVVEASDMRGMAYCVRLVLMSNVANVKSSGSTASRCCETSSYSVHGEVVGATAVRVFDKSCVSLAC